MKKLPSLRSTHSFQRTKARRKFKKTYGIETRVVISLGSYLLHTLLMLESLSHCRHFQNPTTLNPACTLHPHGYMEQPNSLSAASICRQYPSVCSIPKPHHHCFSALCVLCLISKCSKNCILMNGLNESSDIARASHPNTPAGFPPGRRCEYNTKRNLWYANFCHP